jgi:hypothetical protein
MLARADIQEVFPECLQVTASFAAATMLKDVCAPAQMSGFCQHSRQEGLCQGLCKHRYLAEFS